jgi:hypothetical protein
MVRRQRDEPVSEWCMYLFLLPPLPTPATTPGSAWQNQAWACAAAPPACAQAQALWYGLLVCPPLSFAMRLPRSLRMYCSCCSWQSAVCRSQRSPRLDRRSLGPTKSQGCSRVCMQRISGECASACAIPSSNVDRGQRACRQHASGEEQREGKETRGHGFRDGQQMRTAKKGKKTTARAHDPHRRLQPFAAARLVRVDTRVGSGLQGQR